MVQWITWSWIYYKGKLSHVNIWLVQKYEYLKFYVLIEFNAISILYFHGQKPNKNLFINLILRNKSYRVWSGKKEHYGIWEVFCCQINVHTSRLETKIWKYHLPGVKGITLVRVTTSYTFSDISYISVSRRSQFNIIPRHLVNIQCFLILTKRSYSSIKPGSGITVVRDEGDGGLAIPENHRSGPISTVLPVSREFNIVL